MSMCGQYILTIFQWPLIQEIRAVRKLSAKICFRSQAYFGLSLANILSRMGHTSLREVPQPCEQSHRMATGEDWLKTQARNRHSATMEHSSIALTSLVLFISFSYHRAKAIVSRQQLVDETSGRVLRVVRPHCSPNYPRRNPELKKLVLISPAIRRIRGIMEVEIPTVEFVDLF